ncbi:chitobiase/beta-hexosaminidase C-terminal domain-containing protein [Bacteroidales bacterium OttesenSCG-928-L03]|nr:chitobiase/beta-hexosaminidase C-terminal domain-containing protein [Bacteroidales bacterium OttesenSCG-928-L03]
MTEIFEALAEQLNYPIILESARWGNNRKDYMTSKEGKAALYTRNDHWLPLKNKTVSSYFPARNAVVYSQLKNLGLTGSITAPSFNSTGGKINTPISLTIKTSSSDIYYTTNGSDPRVQGSGATSPSATKYTTALVIDKSCTVKARIKSGSSWSPLSEVSFKWEDPSSLPTTNQDLSVDAYYNQGILHLNLPTSGKLSLGIYSVDGMLLQETKTFAVSGSNALPVSNLPEGIYIYRLSLNGESASGKFVYR